MVVVGGGGTCCRNDGLSEPVHIIEGIIIFCLGEDDLLPRSVSVECNVEYHAASDTTMA